MELEGDIAVCNGEIYGFRKDEKKELQKKGIQASRAIQTAK
ncbi:hypothetical protein [Butyrivibrio sp. AE2032]|nr:hypothetical protein [Butyrivibrio sp. AE2032]